MSAEGDGVKQIPLNHGKFALVDDEDYERLAGYHWSIFKMKSPERLYARRVFIVDGKQNMALMHREILGVTERSVFVDHINHDTLDNRRANIRACTPSGNARNARRRKDNTSGYKGVHFHPKTKKWRAGLHLNGKTIHLGLFTTKEEAAAAYRDASTEMYGEFACHG